MSNEIERRNFPRANYPCLIVVRRENPTEAIMTHTENISVGGVRVIIKKRIEVAVPVDLRLDLMDMQPEIACGARIAWVKEFHLKDQAASETIKYDTGIRFVDIDKTATERINTVVKRLLEKEKR